MRVANTALFSLYLQKRFLCLNSIEIYNTHIQLLQMNNLRVHPETSRVLPSLGEKTREMQEYINHQVNNKAPAIIKAHHYLVVHYLKSLSKQNPPAMVNNSSTEDEKQEEKWQNSGHTHISNIGNHSALSQSVVLQPSNGFRGHPGSGSANFPSLFSMNPKSHQRRENEKMNSLPHRYLSNEYPKHSQGRSQFKSLQINRTPHNYSKKNSSKDRSRQLEEMSDEISEQYGQSIRTARNRVQRRMLIRQNSKSQSQKRFRTTKDRTITIEHLNHEEPQVLLLEAIEKNEEKGQARHMRLRRRDLKKKMTIDEATLQQKSPPCAWESREEEDYLMHQDMFDSLQY